MELNGAPVTLAELASLGLVGFGHFTSMRVENRAVRGLSLHLERLTRDCRTVFDVDLDSERVRAFVRHALRDIDDTVVVRVTVFDPHLELSKPGADTEPQVLVSTRKAPPSPQGPLKLQSAVYSRDLPKVKHVGLFGALYQRRAAQRNGFDDVLLTTPDGTIAEIATSNIGLITSDGQLVWPQADVLPGITMQLISQTRDEEVTSWPITLAQLPEFVAAVATNAATGVRAIASIDDTHWPADHELIGRIRKEYESIPAQQI